MPILHGANASPFVRKVRMGLAEKGIAYEQIPVMPMNQTDEFMKISPLGKIPVYQDGEFTVPDSSVILAYLERTNPEPPLYPSDPREYARALWYEEYADTKLVNTLAPIFVERALNVKIFKKDCDEERVQKILREEAPPVFDYLEGQISDGEWLVGARFSVADIAVSSPFVNMLHGGERPDAARWPKLAAYVARAHGRPAFKAAIEEELAQFAAL